MDKTFTKADMVEVFRRYNYRENRYAGFRLPTHESTFYKWIHRLNPPRFGDGVKVLITGKDFLKFATEIMEGKGCEFKPDTFKEILEDY